MRRRTLVYGMQSSGASLVTFFLSQSPGAVGIVDLFCSQPIPDAEELDELNVVAKATVSLEQSLDSQLERFRPDKSILVLRHPAHNYVALSRKKYVNLCGSIDDKFALLESLYDRLEDFDVVLHYEDFVIHRRATVRQLSEAGVTASKDFYRFHRSREDLVEAGMQYDWFSEGFGTKWAFGNVHAGGMSASAVFKHVPADVHDKVKAICPRMYRLCDHHMREHHSPLRVAGSAALNDVLLRPVRRRVKRVKQALKSAIDP